MIIAMREAVPADLPQIVALLVDDGIGQLREDVADPVYREAFAAIRHDPNHSLIVAMVGDRVVGCFQLSFIPGLSRRGSWRAQIESVRVERELRGQGVGGQMMRHAIDLARDRGCGLVQLTTDKRRKDAHRFYEGLGFVASHEGMKLRLDP
ncbi:MAG: GNAT family N-acetyltransferase [Geminicoccaceae bacterium]|nr:GNAT family N-acetyltransferase [Geminicoccaceae bacterium]MCB9945612.1 GNAT family N-acetyltransferase [Geminicoccaceae bacterium]